MLNFIKNIFRKNEDKVFTIEREPKKINRIGTKKQFADKGNREIVICKDCKTEFILTDGEKSFYRERELPYPKRCGECRRIRKQRSVIVNEKINLGKL
jgi:hypothetical protein